MPLIFNSFNRVIESKKYPFSRIWRRDFFEKISDIFWIFAGTRQLENDDLVYTAVNQNDEVAYKEQIGIIDYLTFQLTRMVNKLTSWCYHNLTKDPIALMLFLPTTALFLTFNALHYTAAGILTLPAAVLAIPVHLISKFSYGSHLKNQAAKLHDKDSPERTFGSYLKEKHHSYSDIIIDLQREGKAKISSTILLAMENPDKYECCLNGQCKPQRGHIQFKVDLTKLNNEDKLAIKALIELNAGGLYRNLQKSKQLEAIEEMIKIAPTS